MQVTKAFEDVGICLIHGALDVELVAPAERVDHHRLCLVNVQVPWPRYMRPYTARHAYIAQRNSPRTKPLHKKDARPRVFLSAGVKRDAPYDNRGVPRALFPFISLF